VSNNEDIDVKQLVLERVDYFMSLAKAKKIYIKINVIQNTIIHADRFKISKLLDNLLSNAIKYNKIAGDITLHVEHKKFSVQDSGIGIAKADISKIQERYKRFNKSSGGFGIGLSIVSKIAKEYSLHVEVESKEKIGTTVSVSW